MNTIDKITKELSLRKPQQLSLVKLDAILSGVKLGRDKLEDIEAMQAH